MKGPNKIGHAVFEMAGQTGITGNDHQADGDANDEEDHAGFEIRAELDEIGTIFLSRHDDHRNQRSLARYPSRRRTINIWDAIAGDHQRNDDAVHALSAGPARPHA